MIELHFSMWPLRWEAACGASNVPTAGELPLVTCAECRRVVIAAELRGVALGA